MAVARVGVYVVPHWGWQWMFIIGAVPSKEIWGLLHVLGLKGHRGKGD